jgi:hypothetical protein
MSNLGGDSLGVGEAAKAIGIPLGTSLIMLIVGGVSHWVFPHLWRFFPLVRTPVRPNHSTPNSSVN